MSSTQVDTTPPAHDEGTLQPAHDYLPPAEASPFSSFRSPVYVPRERRLWTAALAAALLVTAGGLGILYVDDTNNQNADRALTSQNEQLTGRNQNLQTALTTTETKLTASESQVSNLRPSWSTRRSASGTSPRRSPDRAFTWPPESRTRLPIT